MITSQELQDILSEENAKLVASEIIDLMEDKISSDTLDIDCNIKQGEMQNDLSQPNSVFNHDTPPDTLLCEVKNAIEKSISDEEDAENNHNEETEQEDGKKNEIILTFLEQVKNNLNNDMHTEVCDFQNTDVNSMHFSENHKRLAKSIQKNIFRSIPEQLMPIPTIIFHNVEIYPSNAEDHVLSIHKKQALDPVTYQPINPPVVIHDDLMETHKETGMDYQDIVEMRKKENDSRYKYVDSVRARRMSFDITCSISADYSLNRSALSDSA